MLYISVPLYLFRLEKLKIVLKVSPSLPCHAVSPPGLSVPGRGLFEPELSGSVGVVGRRSSHHGGSHLLLLEAQSLTETEILKKYTFWKIFF